MRGVPLRFIANHGYSWMAYRGRGSGATAALRPSKPYSTEVVSQGCKATAGMPEDDIPVRLEMARREVANRPDLSSLSDAELVARGRRSW